MARRQTAPQVTADQEVDTRLKILNSIMSCPHRDTDKLKDIHLECSRADPEFYARLASWYYKGGGDIRDHNEVFASCLLTDEYLENRSVGRALWGKHALFMKHRIFGFVKGKTVKIRNKLGTKTKRGRRMVEDTQIIQKEVGLKRNINNGFRTEIRNYLRWLESDPARFDAAALQNFKALKTLYASKSLRIKPGPRAQAILFDKKRPEDSKQAILKKISEAKPSEAAKLIVEHKIPYVIAVGLVEKVTPSILVALIERMSPQEVINNIAPLEEKGAMDNPDIKKMIEEKLEKAKKSKNVATLKSKTAKSTGRVKDEGILKQLDQVADEQVKRKGTISIPTALLIDKSSSMTQAIEVGKRAAALVSGATISDLHVVAFDSMGRSVESRGKTLTDWENAFRPIRAGGWTSMGAGLDFLMRKNVRVEQIVVFTDEGENRPPSFVDAYHAYVNQMNVKPSIVIVHIAGQWDSDVMSKNLTRAGIPFDMYRPENGDYYSLPGLVTLLSRKSNLDLVYEIMATPLVTGNGYRV